MENKEIGQSALQWCHRDTLENDISDFEARTRQYMCFIGSCKRASVTGCATAGKSVSTQPQHLLGV